VVVVGVVVGAVVVVVVVVEGAIMSDWIGCGGRFGGTVGGGGGGNDGGGGGGGCVRFEEDTVVFGFDLDVCGTMASWLVS